METISRNYQYPLRIILGAFLAGALLWLYSFWVPLSDGFYYEWLQGNLFREVQPRALLGTIANLMNFDDRGLMFIKITSLWAWLVLIIWQLAKDILCDFSLKRFYCLLCISFLFSFSTVTQMSFGPVMFIDVIPYLLVLVVYINLASDRSTSIRGYWINAILLTSAVAIHEKSVFDIGILFFWIFYKKGFKKSILALGPGILLSGLFLLMLRSKNLTGESLDTYVSILQRGADFLGDSFSTVEVLVGLGGLGILYLYLSTIFIKSRSSMEDGVKRLVLSISMFIGCMAPLTVAWDTNRLVGLIWLPTIILLVEVGSDLFSRSSIPQMLFLGLLCVYQLLLPPILRFPPNVIIAYNSYAKAIYGDKVIQIDIPVRVGDELLFKDKAKGSQFLRSGWSGPEAWGVWSNHNSAWIQMENLDPRITQATIRFNALVSRLRPNQPIAIYANDQFVGKVIATNHSDNVATIMLPQRGSRTLTIRFDMDELATPAQVGISADDNRKLGVGLTAIVFR